MKKENWSLKHSSSPSLIIVPFSECFTADKKTKKLHERVLKLVYYDDNSTIETLLEKDNIFSIDHQNIHCLLAEIFKVVHGVTENKILKICG